MRLRVGEAFGLGRDLLETAPKMPHQYWGSDQNALWALMLEKSNLENLYASHQPKPFCSFRRTRGGKDDRFAGIGERWLSHRPCLHLREHR